MKKLVAILICLPLFASASIIRPAPENLGLVGYWPQNEATSTTAGDFSTNKNNLTLSGGATWGQGKIAGAVKLDGSTGVLTRANPTGLPTARTARTISYWLYPTSACTAGGGNVFHYGDAGGAGQDYILECFTTGGLTYLFTDGINIANNITMSGSQIPPTNQWTYVTFVFNGTSTWTYYLNGVQVNTGSFGVTINTATPTVINIGDRTDVAQPNFPGYIDELKIWNRALAVSEIQQEYGQGLWRIRNVSNNGLIGYWNFNENTGTKAGDFSGKGYTGTFAGSPTWTQGKLLKSLKFSGSSQAVTVPDNADLDLTGNFTINMWVKPTTLKDYGNIVWKANYPSDGYGIITLANGDVQYQVSPSAGPNPATGAGSLANGRWNMVTLDVVRSTSVKMYIDGVQKYSAAPAFDVTAGNHVLYIGGDNNNNRYFNGTLDEVKFYNRALSADEVSALYQQGITLMR